MCRASSVELRYSRRVLLRTKMAERLTPRVKSAAVWGAADGDNAGALHEYTGGCFRAV
ncbi:hypothetical protein PC129_g5118 [Phytophthora cactorum]|uniref:Uncharacterized protein n=1 Tax=Phytophthora cactorum TaxID=29920 RepID=A0A8T1CIL3_9STRA|nr:hypothetical protein Pcac1_g21089 [Phytophthora cactorum]KAG2827746.1 hypothetical protein PC112_g8737 [Phytophthora cactorum]KAG2833767.1 hypothetical protein PC111_g6085 [Phytophthora cactorum]KAG2865204.1 hypothetical protein PC113_g3916 [Phytophthora cactorum]KAG2910342.1 hypothetical protein PC114_g9816 [Phytophthora cactorum]